MPENIFGRYHIGSNPEDKLRASILNLITQYNSIKSSILLINEYLSTHGVWYGGNDNNNNFNQTLVLNFRGDQINSLKQIGTARSSPVGGGYGQVGMFYGGGVSTGLTNLITKTNAYGGLLATETNSGVLMATQLSSAVIVGTMLVFGIQSNAALYGGNGNDYSAGNLLQIFNFDGTSVSGPTTTAQGRISSGGVAFDGLGASSIAMFYGGTTSQTGTTRNFSNYISRFNPSGALVGAETTLGTPRFEIGGCNLNGNAVYYGGSDAIGVYNTVTRLDINGNQIGSDTSVGTARDSAAGASFNNVGVWYGGNPGIPNSPIVTRLDGLGTMIGMEFNASLGRDNTGVASVAL